MSTVQQASHLSLTLVLSMRLQWVLSNHQRKIVVDPVTLQTQFHLQQLVLSAKSCKEMNLPLWYAMNSRKQQKYWHACQCCVQTA